MVLNREKFGYLRCKAIFQIYLVLIYIIISSLVISPASAQSDVGCCSDDGNGNYCVPTTNNNCSGQWNSASCEQTSFCSLGCCLDGNDGTCSDNVPRVNCEREVNSTFQNDVSCDAISSCQQGCCSLGNEHLFTTQAECTNVILNNYPTLNSNDAWDGSITDEATCFSLGQEDDLGCCVDSDGFAATASCVWTNQGSCPTAGEEDSSSTGSGFYNDIFCSNPNLGCSCTPHAYKQCGGQDNEDVYWVDSCGNLEEIVDDCDPLSRDGGNICTENSGDAYCKSVDCVTTVDLKKTNPDDPKIGGYRLNGESWCTYESGVGGYFDRPGSRHYRNICINGEELVEECKDYREEICVQSGVSEEGVIDNVAKCVDLKTFPKIDLEKYQETNDADESMINPGEKGYDDETASSIFAPSVDRGSKFWKNKNADRCENGDSECTVVYVRKVWGAPYTCEVGCECEEDSYLESSNDYCKMWGDCGADVNILGKGTTDGIEFEWSGDAPGPRPDEISEDYLDSLRVYGIFGALKDIGVNLGGEINNVVKDAVKVVGTVVMVVNIIVYGLQGALGEVIAVLIGIPGYGWVIGLIILILSIIFGDYIAELISLILGYDTLEKEIEVSCKPWVAPSGGDDCDKCDNDPRYNDKFYDNPVLCEKYRCKSLGTACDLVNVGTTQQACLAKNPNDVTPPKIIPWNSLIESQRNSDGQNYQVDIYAGENGFSITPEVDPLELMTIGIKTDELARCRWDVNNVPTFSEMDNDFSEGNEFVEQHNFTWGFNGGEDVELYVRCIDFYENGKDTAPYAIDFRTKNIPDFKDPRILDYSLSDGIITESNNGNAKGIIGSGINATSLILYLDEPVEVCRWDVDNVPFIEMDEDNIFYCGCYDPPENSACLGNGVPVNGTELCDYFNDNGAMLDNEFKCVGRIDEIRLEENNDYYISCVDVKKDYGGGCNTISPSKKFELKSSGVLSITSVEPENGTYYDSNFVLHLTTSGGAENGNAVCDFDEGNGKIEFFDTGNNNHFQTQARPKGVYDYEFTCEDIVGNTAKAYSSIIIDADEIDPVIKNVYTDGGQLFVLTDEDSICEYSTTDDNFALGDGVEMAGNMVKSHSLAMEDDVYYIQCYDVYGNEGNIITVYNTV
ncbi:MAG: hypothetical protein Q8Q42_02000 [Nanoarchaeota archaeon]|nr:hypothetical protein [Nanoarchaeota archaeon]